jgi:pimeloyl-ACP methyl ester carboxylesterase
LTVRHRFIFQFAVFFAVLIMSLGCASTQPGELSDVQPYSKLPRAGNVYLLRGWIGIFSYGIDDLAHKINSAGVRANVYQADQWEALAQTIEKKYKSAPKHEPLILVGHSYGADDALRISRVLQDAGIAVDLVIAIDPVTPPPVPGNVRRCYDIYQSHGSWDKVPAFRGVPLQLAEGSRTQLQNVDIRKDRTDLLEPGTDHFNIEKKGKVHMEVLREILAVCPPRARWIAHPISAPPSTAAAKKD